MKEKWLCYETINTYKIVSFKVILVLLYKHYLCSKNYFIFLTQKCSWWHTSPKMTINNRRTGRKTVSSLVKLIKPLQKKLWWNLILLKSSVFQSLVVWTSRDLDFENVLVNIDHQLGWEILKLSTMTKQSKTRSGERQVLAGWRSLSLTAERESKEW